MSEAEAIGCTCGILVFGGEELDELGLCVVCAGSGHAWECACVECAVYWEGTESGEAPTIALELARSEFA